MHTSIETMRALSKDQVERTAAETDLVTAWAGERARTMVAAPTWSSEGWLRLRTDDGIDVDALAALIVDAVDGDGALDFIADDDAGRADWSATDLVDLGWREHADGGMVRHELKSDAALNLTPAAVPAVMQSHRPNKGMVKGRRGISVGGPVDQAAADLLSVEALTRWNERGTIEARDLVAAADALLGDDHALIGTDEYAWSEMTPPLSGDVRIDIDGADHAHTVLSWRADVVEELAARGAITSARAQEERATGETLREAMTMAAPRKPAYTAANLVATSKVDGRRAHALPRVIGSGLVPMGKVSSHLVKLPNVVTDGRTVWTFDADGAATVEAVVSAKARKAEDRREADRLRKAAQYVTASAPRQAATELLATLTAEGQSVEIGDWRVMLVTPAVPSRKAAAILRADNGTECIVGPPRKVATLVSR